MTGAPLDLFSETDAAFVPSTKVETSKQAAASIAIGGAAHAARQVYLVVRSRGAEGATADEVDAATNLGAPTVTARLWELVGKNRKHPPKWSGLLIVTERKRKTRRGRPAFVYLAKEFA